MVTSRPGRGQRGQAIVFIALMLAVVVGMAALAIDGSRAYAARRDLQAAVDAAALAAADSFQSASSYATAESIASTSFGVNLRLYAAPSCSPGFGSPGAGPLTITCTYSDGTRLLEVVSALGAGGSQFTLTASRSLSLQFARILTNGALPLLSASSGGSVNNLLYSPAIAALNQSGCGGAGGNAISINGSGSLTVSGDVVSSGTISMVAGSLKVAGDIYARCQASVAGSVNTLCYPSGAATPCTFPDVAGVTRAGYHFTDPGYPAPALGGGGQPRPTTTVELSPGSYAVNPSITSGCYFLSAGVYQWLSGYTNTGGFVSNELKPPDEPNANNNTQRAAQQFWNTNNENCGGGIDPETTPGLVLPTGVYGIEVTSVRTDTLAGVSYPRESAPSVCVNVNVNFLQQITVDISNVPGATSYNIYASPPPNGCAGPFGLARNVAVVGTPDNSDTTHCPFGAGMSGMHCTLGSETVNLDISILNFGFNPDSGAAPGTFEAYPPSSETAPLAAGLPNQNPDRNTPPLGDRANENECTTAGAVLTTCPGFITPGAVSFNLPAASCLNESNGGDNYTFSGYQYNWIAVYEPSGSFCANVLGAAGNSAFIGLVYTPTASISFPSSAAFLTEATGGIIGASLTFSGALPTIAFSPNYAPVPPAARLVS